ncbi:hypothetical protein NE857_03450 [Nocardiopsis exhalans]|uniref:Uncharacterized protein n=1 Tax=Nocardiopsis exhalans TaxID=163604 RepID=A0ABY5DCE8_9ACTN|nr:hypothetical protein [Nocardiopsis exhalans]USY20726.1 hypothetical protein NE857_03450 [Nocardiopsis exhalans]
MSTSMPHKRRPIEVNADQVAYLRRAEPGSLLVWIEASNEVQVYAPTGRFGEHRMIIAAQGALDGLTEACEENGRPTHDGELAKDLTDIANDWLSGWSQVRVLTAMLTPIRLRLDRMGIYPADSVHLEGRGPGPDQPRVTETYARPGGNGAVRVTVPLGYTEPVRIRAHGVNGPVSEHIMLFDYLGMRPEQIEAKIAATVAAHLALYQD